MQKYMFARTARFKTKDFVHIKIFWLLLNDRLYLPHARPVGSAAASSSAAEFEIAEPLTELSPSDSPPAGRRRKLTESATFQDQRKAARQASALKLDEIAQKTASRHADKLKEIALKSARRKAARDLGYVSPTDSARREAQNSPPRRSKYDSRYKKQAAAKPQETRGNALRMRCLARKLQPAAQDIVVDGPGSAAARDIVAEWTCGSCNKRWPESVKVSWNVQSWDASGRCAACLERRSLLKGGASSAAAAVSNVKVEIE